MNRFQTDIVENTCPVNNEKDSTSTRLTSNAATAPKDHEKYFTEQEHVLLINVFLEIGVKDAHKFLSNGIRNDETLIKCLTTFGYAWDNFLSIKKKNIFRGNLWNVNQISQLP